ncbi:bi-domain-containing oxidoreductase [Methanogenium sp. S4BF]|uniref:bi-domain-containing oxidoreductase n=1 Tax=Methanogenium sp. S4BF TaxID=1789226 RepID=UPI002417FB8C|nr:bi-domain-containing oxidoreductase [Methanogenium sp. S4BF]WFN35015.1 bi-domain-containing oxidoreductase [Methanogenium sp. S4BF]
MKQVLLDLNSGAISVEDVPVPSLKKGVVVKNHFSLISAGTESSLLSLADKSKLGKARERPDLAQKVINKAKTDGVLSAYQQAVSRLAKPEALGYSCAGIVTDSNVSEFSVGDRVACAGAGYASHAEYVSIPKNLTIKVPDNVSLEDAAFTTVGSIAMQGIRNAEVTVGERVVVIGLGLVGLLSVQIAKAAGCRVFGIDVDPKKIALSLELGADIASNYDGLEERMASFSPFGADKVIITAATSSNGPIEVAGDLVREKGRVVAVGAVGLNIPRDKYYEKEAEFVISKSYGPGRYDRSYEEKGIDYPIIVRWTEKRNMDSFLELISEGKINLQKIVTHEFTIEEATDAYDLITSRKEPYLGILLKYNPDTSENNSTVVYLNPSKSDTPSHANKNTNPDKIQNENSNKNTTTKTNSPIKTIGCIGAGIQAMSALYPNLAKLPVEFRGLATSTGLSAQSAGKKFGFSYCTTDYKKILEDKEIDAVIIATRNDLHAKMTIEALEAGKDVFVEKPLATNMEDLEVVAEAWKNSDKNVQVGFNRRYSSLTGQLRDFFRNRSSPMVIHYRVNTGPIPADLWVNDEEQGGGMLISECCHFIDYILCLTVAKPIEVYAKSVDPSTAGSINRFSNLQIVISLDDGSIGTVTYTTLGDKAYSKEQVEVFCDGMVGVLTDFRELRLVKNGKETKTKRWLSQDKGFPEELNVFLRGFEDNFPDSVSSTLLTLKARESIEKRLPVAINVDTITD